MKFSQPAFQLRVSRSEIRDTLEEKAATAKRNGPQVQDVPGHNVLLDLVINNVPKDAVGDGDKV